MESAKRARTGEEASTRVCACRTEGKRHLVVNMIFTTHGDDGDLYSHGKSHLVLVPVADLFRDRTMDPYRIARTTYKVNLRFHDHKLKTEMPQFLQGFCKDGAFGPCTQDVDRPLRPDALRYLSRCATMADVGDVMQRCGQKRDDETEPGYRARLQKAAAEVVRNLPEAELRRRATRSDACALPRQDFSDYYVPAGYTCLEENATSSSDATVLVETHYTHST